MKIKMNNRGFTLVELIVATAILAIVALGASAFMVAGTRTYSSLNYTVRLQYEAQLAMAQLQEYAVDCSKGMAWDASQKKLYIANDADVHVFGYDNTNKTISYSTGALAENLTFTVADALVAEHVESMDVDVRDKQVEITLNMARGGKTYSATQVIALRNQPKSALSWAALWSAIRSTI